MRRIALAVAIAGFALPASAQVQTVCRRVGLQVICNSGRGVAVPAPTYDTSPLSNTVQQFDLGRPLADAEAIRAAQLRNQAEAAVRAAAQNRRETAAADTSLRQNLGALISQGRCPEARETALGAGRLDLAQQVDALCAAQPK
jgi:hypothetical protein